jgi:hypothetical protein
VVEQDVAFNRYLHGIGGALAGQRATGKPGSAGFYAVIYGRMNLDSHVGFLIGC